MLDAQLQKSLLFKHKYNMERQKTRAPTATKRATSPEPKEPVDIERVDYWMEMN